MAAGWKKRCPVLAHLHFGSHGRDRQYDVNLGKSSNESWWLIQNNIQQFVNGICFLKNSWKIWWLPSEIQTWLGNPPPKLRFLPGKIIELNGVWVPEGLWKNIHETNQGFPMSQATTPALTNNVTSRRDRKHWLNFGAFGSLSRFRSCGKLKVSIRSSLVPLFVVGKPWIFLFFKAPSIHPFNLRHPGVSSFRRTAFHQVALAALDASVQRRVWRREACRHFVSWQSDFNAGHNGSLIHPVGAPETGVHQNQEWEDYLTRRSVNMCILHLQLAQEGHFKESGAFSRLPLLRTEVHWRQANSCLVDCLENLPLPGRKNCAMQVAEVLTPILHTVLRKMHMSTIDRAARSPWTQPAKSHARCTSKGTKVGSASACVSLVGLSSPSPLASMSA